MGRMLFWLAACICLVCATLSAQPANLGGWAALRAYDPSLNGSGVRAAQPEAGAPNWQVNPATVIQPVSLFEWISGAGTATTYPNSLGSESGHASEVGRLFYGGNGNGVAPGLERLRNYDVNYFLNNIIPQRTPINAQILNQSFGTTYNVMMDRNYDNYAAAFTNVVILSGAGNEGPLLSPSTCYNGIAVAADGGSSSGPTADGRSKPDITANGGLTSWATPVVSGAAAILVQAGARGDGGVGTAGFLSDSRLIKALLLNGADKTFGWTNTLSTPLHPRYGAGMVNILNSYRQLRGGKKTYGVQTSGGLGIAHLPPAPSGVITARRGWDFGLISSTVTQERANHYFFAISNSLSRTLTATLVWFRQQNETAINDLDLALYDADSKALLRSSQSQVDNVEHLHLSGLPAGNYDLQVIKRGGPQRVSNEETYALAFDFGPAQQPAFADSKRSSNSFVATLTGEPQQTYLVESTTNFISWARSSTNTTSPAGITTFSNSISPGAKRYFRAALLP